MAKPGTDEARALAAMSRQAADIPRSIPEEMQTHMRFIVEGQRGQRCGGCQRRITIGFQFQRVELVMGQDGAPIADIQRLSACNRDDCDFADEARKNADFCEMVEYAWLDEGGPDFMPELPAGPDLDPNAAEREPMNGGGPVDEAGHDRP